MSSTTSVTDGRSNDSLWGVVGIIGVLVLGYVYVAPQMTQLKDARAAVQAREQDNQDIQSQISEVAQLSQQLNTQQEALARLALAVPVGVAADQLLVALQAIASESGVVLLSVQPTVVDGSQSSSVVALRGSYSRIHSFFELLQKNIRPLSATNVNIASASDETSIALLNVSLTITAAQVNVDTPIPADGAQL